MRLYLILSLLVLFVAFAAAGSKCIQAGGACVIHRDCCRRLGCQGGQCKRCGFPGDACKSDKDCCTLTECINGKCKPENPTELYKPADPVSSEIGDM